MERSYEETAMGKCKPLEISHLHGKPAELFLMLALEGLALA
jgi:hypothetical protein